MHVQRRGDAKRAISWAQSVADYTPAYSATLFAWTRWFARLLTRKDIFYYADAYLLQPRLAHAMQD